MVQPVGDAVVAEVVRAVEAGSAIDYGSQPDKEHPQITWAITGLPSSNEIAVVASCGDLRFGIKAVSPLDSPAMSSRAFGMDTQDVDLSLQLSEQLWESKGSILRDEAMKIGGMDSLRTPDQDSLDG